MEKKLDKSGLRLRIGFLGVLMLVGTGSSYAQTSLKNTPLYKHLIKRRTSKPATPKKKPVGARSALPETAKLLPLDTALLINIENVSQLKGQFEKTDLFKLYKDPSMAAFVDKFKAGLKQRVVDSHSELAAIVSDASMLPEGRAALALVLNEKTIDADQPPVMFIAEWGDKAAQAKEMVEKIFAEGAEEGQASRQTQDYRGTVITSTTGQSPGTLSCCFIDDAMILSANAESLKFVIDQAKGAGGPTLADDEIYNSTLKAVSSSGPGQIDVYVNIEQIMQTVTAQDQSGKIKGILTKLGLDNVTSFALSFDVGSTTGKALLKTTGAKKGICKLLEFESSPLQAPRFVSASANSVSFVNLNLKKAFDEIVKMLTAFSPEIAMMLNMPLSPPGAEGEQPLQLKTGIIDHLGSQIVVAQSAAGSAASAGAPGSDSLLALAVTNRAALEKSLLAIHSNIMGPDDPDARQELLGHTIYRVDLFSLMFGLGGGLGDIEMMGEMPDMEMDMDVNMPDMEMDMEMDMNMPDMEMDMEMDMNMPDMEMDMDMEMPALAFTVTDMHLIFGSEEAVERAIQTVRGGKSLASAEWFARAKSAIPAEVGIAGLQNSEAFAEVAWSTLRNMEVADEDEAGSMDLIGLAGVPSPQMLLSLVGADQFDFSLLPDFDAVRKYFGLSASYGIARQDGFFFEFRYMNPK